MKVFTMRLVTLLGGFGCVAVALLAPDVNFLGAFLVALFGVFCVLAAMGAFK